MSRNLECWIEGFMFLTDNTEPPAIFRRWVALSTVASALQRKCWINWGMETFYPNMYVVLIGPPAARKGTAMRFGRLFLDRLGIALSADETSRQALIAALREAAATASIDGKPYCHSSLTVHSSELTVFLGYEEKDRLSVLCDLYDCRGRFRYDTLKRGKEEIPNVWLNLIGATTPAQLQASVPEGFVGSGFTSRVIFVYAANKGKVVIIPEISPEQAKTLEALLLDLTNIHHMEGIFQPTEGFRQLYTAWRLNAESTTPRNPELFNDQKLAYYIQRRPAHLFKLAMSYSAARTGSFELTEQDLGRAIVTLEEVEQQMSTVFSGVGANPIAGVQARIRSLLRERGELSFEELTEIFTNDATMFQLKEAINALQEMKVCTRDVANRKIKYLLGEGRRAPREKEKKEGALPDDSKQEQQRTPTPKTGGSNE